MALKDKKSLYDRHHKGHAGVPVGQTFPNEGPYFTDEGSTTSPFDVKMGLKSDQMVELLTKEINTTTGNVYKPAPNQSPLQDLDGADPNKYMDNLPT